MVCYLAQHPSQLRRATLGYMASADLIPRIPAGRSQAYVTYSVTTGGETFTVPAVGVRMVETTGAGDSFNAGFLTRFVRGASLEECARAGAAAGARAVTRVGGTAAFEED